jgi:hypothetical protein
MKIWTKGIMTGLLAGGLILGSLPAQAGPNRPDFGRRDLRQGRRISRGVQSGQVTPREFGRLGNQRGRIHAAGARMRADGRFNRFGRGRLNQMGHRSSRNINRYRHNNQYRRNNFRQARFRHNNFGHNNYRHNHFRQAHFGQNNFRHNHFRQGNFGQNNFRHNNFSRANWRPGRR